MQNNAGKNGLSVNNDDVTIGVKTISTEAGSTVSQLYGKYAGENGVSVNDNKVGLSYDTGALNVVQDAES